MLVLSSSSCSSPSCSYSSLSTLHQRHPDLLVLEGVGLELQLLGEDLQLLLKSLPLLRLLIYLTLATP